MTDDELKQYWDARPYLEEQIHDFFYWEWSPSTVAEETGVPLEAVNWLYRKFPLEEVEN